MFVKWVVVYRLNENTFSDQARVQIPRKTRSPINGANRGNLKSPHDQTHVVIMIVRPTALNKDTSMLRAGFKSTEKMKLQ